MSFGSSLDLFDLFFGLLLSFFLLFLLLFDLFGDVSRALTILFVDKKPIFDERSHFAIEPCLVLLNLLFIFFLLLLRELVPLFGEKREHFSVFGVRISRFTGFSLCSLEGIVGGHGPFWLDDVLAPLLLHIDGQIC